MSPESARPLTAGASMPGLPPVPQLGAGGRVALGEGLDHPEHVVDRRRPAGARARGPPRAAPRDSGRRSPWSGRASSLPVPQCGADGGRAQGVEQHRLADAAQPGQHDGALGPALAIRSSTTSKARSCSSRPASSGRALAGAGGVRVADRVHDRRVWGRLAPRRFGDTRRSCRPWPRPFSTGRVVLPESGQRLSGFGHAGASGRRRWRPSRDIDVYSVHPIHADTTVWRVAAAGTAPLNRRGHRSPAGRLTPPARPSPAGRPSRTPWRGWAGMWSMSWCSPATVAARPAPARPPSPRAASG